MKYWFQAIASAIGNGLMAPIRAAMELFGWIGQSAAASRGDDDGEEPRPLWLRVLLLPINLVIGTATLFAQVVSYPFQGWFQDPISRRKLLCGLPALLAILSLLGIVAQHSGSAGTVQAIYSRAFDEAAKNKDFGTARLYADKLVRSGVRSTPEVAFQYCKLLATDNDLERANAMIETLAPNDAPGYAPAHRQRAIAYAGLYGRTRNSQFLTPLLWHLNQTNDRRDENTALAWATYYDATQQFPLFIKQLQIAADTNPDHWTTISNFFYGIVENIKDKKDIDTKLKYLSEAIQAMKNAHDAYRRELGANPVSVSFRLRLTKSLIDIDKLERRIKKEQEKPVDPNRPNLDEARKIVQAGLEFDSENEYLKRAIGSIEWATLESMVDSMLDDVELLKQSNVVLMYADQRPFVYDQLVNIYGKTGRPESKQEIQEILEASAAAEPENALLQLALSTLAIVERQIVSDELEEIYGETERIKLRKILEASAAADPENAVVQQALKSLAIVDARTDEAIALLEKTLIMDPKIHLAKNNLAWLLAERNSDQLDRPLQLAEEAVTASPTKPNYRDTLGEILFRKGEFQRAITESEIALPGMPALEKVEIRERLAKAYEAIGDPSIAESYRALNKSN